MKNWKEFDVLDEKGMHKNSVLLNVRKEFSPADRGKLLSGKPVERHGRMYSISKITV